jgi:hypothetical protein
VGDVGVQGFQGWQNAVGDAGPQGAVGDAGVQGNQGNAGVDGTQGFQGYEGVQGNQGFQGNQGEVGIQGPQGSMPSPDMSTLTSSANHVAWDTETNDKFVINLSQSTTIDTPSNLIAGYSFVMFIRQNVGVSTVAYSSKFMFTNGIVPVASTASGSIDVLEGETFTNPADGLVYIWATLSKGIA